MNKKDKFIRTVDSMVYEAKTHKTPMTDSFAKTIAFWFAYLTSEFVTVLGLFVMDKTGYFDKLSE